MIHPLRHQGWILSNPRTRKHIELDAHGLNMFLKLSAGADESKWNEGLADAKAWDRSEFTNAQGLMSDPTGFGDRKTQIAGAAVFQQLKNNFIIEESSGKTYQEFLNLKTSILDKNHLGSFHQVVGQFQLIDLRRKDKWRWWHDQKFNPDGMALKPGYYSYIQGHFFDRYFAEANLKNKKILDFGCGNGYYSARFQKFEASVWGIDTSPELIEMAKKNYADRPQNSLEFVCAENEEDCLKRLEALPKNSFDMVYMSDVLLFFFHDLKTHNTLNEALVRLLKAFHAALKPEGRMYIMEPNGCFWLTPWYGTKDRAHTVVTEYRDRLYHVAPTTNTVIHTLGQSGFAVTDLRHPEHKEWEEGMDPNGYAFAKAFPVWDFYECVKL